MNCNSCIIANHINRCAASLDIENVSGPVDGDYNVIITDTATGKEFNFPVEASGGSLVVDLSTTELMNGRVYHVEVYLDGNYQDPREITIAGQSACCVEFSTRDFEIGGETAETLTVVTCE